MQDTLGLTSDSTVWRVLCLLAMLVSIGAAVLSNIAKTQDDVARLSTAEAANAEPEGLSTLLEFGHLSVSQFGPAAGARRERASGGGQRGPSPVGGRV